ncbi:MAG TPA: XRE family transcriptional regulator [Verrucomicrobiales bacterium]|nr:XRE family transcriptional regulator [Verrucomicrobiales bacterium]
MPKQPKLEHPLRIIRKTAGFTNQKRFGELVGVSGETIKSVETGRLKISQELASRIMMATGACPLELRKYSSTGKPTGKAQTQFGEPYSKEFFEHWKAGVFKATEENAVQDARTLYGWLEVLFLASARPGTDKLATLKMGFIQWLEEAKDTFGLNSQVKAVLKDRPVKALPLSPAMKRILDQQYKTGERAKPKKAKKITHYTAEWSPISMSEVPNTKESTGVIKGRKDLYHD